MTTPPNPADALHDAPIEDLVGILLQQFNKYYASHDLRLTQAEIGMIGAHAARRAPLPPMIRRVIDLTKQPIQESLDTLQNQFDFDYKTALSTQMDNVKGWETTAEFLELANIKNTAELRVSAGASLLALLGDADYAQELVTVIQVNDDVQDVDTVFAKRALSHLLQLDVAAADWLPQVRAALSTLE